MAKYCEVCKQPYPDDQASCPHCAARSEPGSKENIDLEQLGVGGVSGEPGSGSKASILRRSVQTQLAPASEQPAPPPGEAAGQPPEAAASGGTPPGEGPPPGPSLAIEGQEGGTFKWSPKLTKLATRQPAAGSEEGPARRPATQLAKPEEGGEKKKRTDVIPGGQGSQPGGKPTQLAPPGEQPAPTAGGGEAGEDILSSAEVAEGASGPISSIPEMDLDELIKTEQMMAENSAVDLGSDPEVSFVEPSSEIDLQPGTRRRHRTTDGEPPSEISPEDLLEGDVAADEEGGEAGTSGAVEAGEVFDEDDESTALQDADQFAGTEADEEATEVAEGDLGEAEELAEDADEATTLHAGTDELVERLHAHDTAADDAATEEVAEEPAEEISDEAGTDIQPPETTEPAPAPTKAARGGLVTGAIGGVIGAVAASVVFVGLLLLGVIGGSEKPATRAPVGPVGNVTPGGPPPIAASGDDARTAGLRYLSGGDYQKAAASLEQAPPNPETQAAAGEAFWLAYLQKQRRANAPLKADDPEVAKAQEWLKKSSDPTAWYWLGKIQEQTGQEAEARQTYEQGLKKFAAARWMFQAALDQLDSRGAAGGAVGAPGARLPRPTETELAAELTLYLVALQAAPANEPATQEAGAKFWEALRLAHSKHDYRAAVAALQQAKANHEKRRFERLDKAQNPITDRYEDIFVRSADELQAYWQLLDKLSALDPRLAQDPAKAIEAAVKGNTAASDALAKAAQALGAKEPFAQTVPASAAELVSREKKAADEQKKTEEARQAAVAEKQAADQKIQQLSQSLATAAGIKEADPTRALKELVAARDALEKVARRLEPTYLDPKTNVLTAAGQDALLSSLDKLRQAGSFPLGTAIDVWPVVLQDRSRKDVLDQALRDGRAVAAEPKADGQAKAKGRYVEGLALRNMGQFDEARKALRAALDTPDAKAGGWRTAAQQALRELTDPDAYYLPRPTALRAEGKDQEAFAILEEGLKPGLFADNGRLLALRSLVHLGLARRTARGARLTPDTPGVKAARSDAEAAVQAGTRAKQPLAVADGHYALGRLAEELGNWDEAEKNYAGALAALKPLGTAADTGRIASRSRLGRARSMLRLRDGAPARPDVNPRENTDRLRVGWRLGERDLIVASATFLARADLFHLDPTCPVLDVSPALSPVRELPTGTGVEGGTEAAAARSRNASEAIRLADAAIASGDKEAYLVKGLALADTDDWTDGLLVYVQGLEELVRPPRYPAAYGEHINGLRYLVKRNPALLPPTTVLAANRPSPDVVRTTTEAIRLADEAIAERDPEGYLIKGLALAEQGRWRDGLRVYVEGLQKILRPRAYADGLHYLVANNPAFQRPDSIYPPNEVEANRHFGAGLDAYWAGDYARAEREIREAVHYNGQDARYLYYLGLARLALPGKRALAYDDFRLAGLLEQLNRPGTPAVGRSLERVQGPARALLNDKAGRVKRRTEAAAEAGSRSE